jgi:hypothetical protein
MIDFFYLVCFMWGVVGIFFLLSFFISDHVENENE